MTNLTYIEKSDVLVRASTAVARYCVKMPVLSEETELSEIYEDAVNTYIKAVQNKAFKRAEADFDAFSASQNASKFETRQYLLTVTVTDKNAKTLSLLTESVELCGLRLTEYQRRSVVWSIEKKRPLSLKDLLSGEKAKLKALPKHWHTPDGIYIDSVHTKDGQITLFRRLQISFEGHRLRDRNKHYEEFSIQ